MAQSLFGRRTNLVHKNSGHAGVDGFKTCAYAVILVILTPLSFESKCGLLFLGMAPHIMILDNHLVPLNS
jgi:hypothetical protein